MNKEQQEQEELNLLWAKHDEAEREMRMWKRKIDEFHKAKEVN